MEDLTKTKQDLENKTSAERIELKRRYKRKRRLLRAKQGLIVITLVLLAGFASYLATEMNLLKSDRHAEAGASVESIKKKVPIYERFATVGTSSLGLSLPGKDGNVICVGFHQAERREAVAITPSVEYLDMETTKTVRNAIVKSKSPVLFVMNSRGRGSAFTSAMDIAMIPNSEVFSPVDGVVTTVKTYNLYGKVTDYHVEIQPDGYPDLRVAIIHIENVQLRVGQRATRRSTLIGSLRPLPQIQSQINRYLPESTDHVHIQVNPATANGDLGS